MIKKPKFRQGDILKTKMRITLVSGTIIPKGTLVKVIEPYGISKNDTSTDKFPGYHLKTLEPPHTRMTAIDQYKLSHI